MAGGHGGGHGESKGHPIIYMCSVGFASMFLGWSMLYYGKPWITTPIYSFLHLVYDNFFVVLGLAIFAILVLIYIKMPGGSH